MNWIQIKVDWKHVSDKIRRTWGKLSDGDLVAIAGDREELSRRIQQRYGYPSDRSERMIDEFAAGLNPHFETYATIGPARHTL